MNFMKWIDEKLSPIIGRLAANTYISAVKEGMISVMGLTIIGSFFLLLVYLPVPESWHENIGVLKWISLHKNALLMPFRATMSIIGVFAVIGTAISLANKTKLDPTVITILSLISFFMTINWIPAIEAVTFQTLTITADNHILIQKILNLTNLPIIGDNYNISQTPITKLGLVLSLENLGSKGIFVGFLCVFTVVSIFRFFKQKKWTIKMPNGVPDGVINTFESLFPLLVIVSLFGLLYLIPSLFPNIFPTGIIDLHTILQKLFFWLPLIINSLLGALLMVLFITILWTAGIHGSSVVEAFTMPILLQLFEANAMAYINGEPIPYILTNQFYYAFVWIGGGGATLALAFLMSFVACSQYMKTLGKAVLPPSLFNINEPIVFGTPIVLNPYFFIPYIIGPMICVITSYIAIKTGLVNPTVSAAPWTFPAPLYAYITTGGDWRAIVLVLFNLALMFGIYFPFFWAYDSKLYKEEQGEKND